MGTWWAVDSGREDAQFESGQRRRAWLGGRGSHKMHERSSLEGDDVSGLESVLVALLRCEGSVPVQEDPVLDEHRRVWVQCRLSQRGQPCSSLS